MISSKIRIDQFLDSAGRITQLPSKQKKQQAVLEYLTNKFELGRMYSERQVNEICDQWHTFGDSCLLRRELIDNGLLGREQDGSKYWRIWVQPSSDEEPMG